MMLLPSFKVRMRNCIRRSRKSRKPSMLRPSVWIWQTVELLES